MLSYYTVLYSFTSYYIILHYIILHYIILHYITSHNMIIYCLTLYLIKFTILLQIPLNYICIPYNSFLVVILPHILFTRLPFPYHFHILSSISLFFASSAMWLADDERTDADTDVRWAFAYSSALSMPIHIVLGSLEGKRVTFYNNSFSFFISFFI